MRLHNSQAILPSAPLTPSAPSTARLHRNRLILIALVTTALLLTVAGWLTTTTGRGPLLLSVDEMGLQRSALFDPSTWQSPLPMPLLHDHAQPPVLASHMIVDASHHQANASDDQQQVDDNDVNSERDVRWFNGRPIRPVRTLKMVVTAYSPDAQSCGESADNITASGYSVWTNAMKLAAADTDVLPFGSIITVPGYDHGRAIPVLDRGGAIKGHRLDVLYPTHEQALRWGVQTLEVTVWEYADGQPHDFQPRYHQSASVAR